MLTPGVYRGWPATRTSSLVRKFAVGLVGGVRYAPALVTRVPPELPIFAQRIDILWQEVGFRDRVDRVEG